MKELEYAKVLAEHWNVTIDEAIERAVSIWETQAIEGKTKEISVRLAENNVLYLKGKSKKEIVDIIEEAIQLLKNDNDYGCDVYVSTDIELIAEENDNKDKEKDVAIFLAFESTFLYTNEKYEEITVTLTDKSMEYLKSCAVGGSAYMQTINEALLNMQLIRQTLSMTHH